MQTLTLRSEFDCRVLGGCHGFRGTFYQVISFSGQDGISQDENLLAKVMQKELLVQLTCSPQIKRPSSSASGLENTLTTRPAIRPVDS